MFKKTLGALLLLAVISNHRGCSCMRINPPPTPPKTLIESLEFEETPSEIKVPHGFFSDLNDLNGDGRSEVFVGRKDSKIGYVFVNREGVAYRSTTRVHYDTFANSR
jgi:hypothetical protein